MSQRPDDDSHALATLHGAVLQATRELRDLRTELRAAVAEEFRRPRESGADARGATGEAVAEELGRLGASLGEVHSRLAANRGEIHGLTTSLGALREEVRQLRTAVEDARERAARDQPARERAAPDRAGPSAAPAEAAPPGRAGSRARAPEGASEPGSADAGTDADAGAGSAGAPKAPGAPPASEAHGALLRQAARVSSVTLVCHRDIWEFVTGQAARHPHFRVPPRVVDHGADRVAVALSGRLLIAVLISLWHTRHAAPADDGDWALATTLYERVEGQLAALQPRGAPVTVALDDGTAAGGSEAAAVSAAVSAPGSDPDSVPRATGRERPGGALRRWSRRRMARRTVDPTGLASVRVGGVAGYGR